MIKVFDCTLTAIRSRTVKGEQLCLQTLSACQAQA